MGLKKSFWICGMIWGFFTCGSPLFANDSSCVLLNGHESHIEVDHHTELELLHGGTVELWFCSSGFGDSDWPRLISKSGSTGPDGGWELVLKNNEHLQLFVNGTVQTTPPLNLELNRWYHAAVSFNASERVFYLDGREVFRTEETALPLPDASPLRIGDTSGGGRNFIGKIRDVRIWNRLRDSGQIKQNHDRRLNGEQPGLVSYWPLDEGSGNLVRDIVGNKNGELRGGAAWSLSEPFIRDLRTPVMTPGDSAVSFGPVELRNPSGTVSYQWYFNGNVIEGATQAVLTVPGRSTADLRDYLGKAAGIAPAVWRDVRNVCRPLESIYVEVNDDRILTPVRSASVLLPAPAITLPGPLVYRGDDGRLKYSFYANNGCTEAVNTVPDFSYAGYRGGGTQIPDVPVRMKISPDAGDNLQQIQSAIDYVSSLPPDSDGFRGALLLEKGRYEVEGTLHLHTGGVVLRGEGRGEEDTVLIATRRSRHDFIVIGGDDPLAPGPVSAAITTPLVPVGSRAFEVSDSSGFTPGDLVFVRRTPNQVWVDTLMEGFSYRSPWVPASFAIGHERRITDIAGNRITVNVPLVDTISEHFGGGVLEKIENDSRVRNVGVEHLRIESIHDSATFTFDQWGRKSYADEEHAWVGIQIRNSTDCWVRKVTGVYFGMGAVHLSGSSFCTVEDTAMLDAVSLMRGARRYSFAVNSGGAGILFQRCYARNGRHDFATSSRVTGPVVWVDCFAEQSLTDSGSHHRWATGILFDNVKDNLITFQNRGASASGHGWAGAQAMVWNSVSYGMSVEAPPGAMNWAVGSRSQIETRGTGWGGGGREPRGIWQSHNAPVNPRSLYYSQLRDRMGEPAVRNVILPEQLNGTKAEIYEGIKNAVAGTPGQEFDAALRRAFGEPPAQGGRFENPRAAVTKSWEDVLDAAGRLDKRIGDGAAESFVPAFLAKIVLSKSIQPEQMYLVHELSYLRDQILDDRVFDPSDDSVARYVELAGELRSVLEKAVPGGGAVPRTSRTSSASERSAQEAVPVSPNEFRIPIESNDYVVGEKGAVQSGRPGYYHADGEKISAPDTFPHSSLSAGLIGSSGGGSTRHSINPVMKFRLPHFREGAVIDEAWIEFSRRANDTSSAPQADLYGLDPRMEGFEHTEGLYYAASDGEPDSRLFAVLIKRGAVLPGEPEGLRVKIDVTEFIQSFYRANATEPEVPSAYFRLSPTRDGGLSRVAVHNVRGRDNSPSLTIKLRRTGSDE